MKFSTRSRYGLRFMIELATRSDCGRPILLREVSLSQDIPEKYLSKIVLPLKTAGLIISARGAKGGYILGKDAKDITAYDIIKVLESDIAPVDCINTKNCNRYKVCSAKDFWSELNGVVIDFLKSKNLQNLSEENLKIQSDSMYYI